MSPDRGDFGYIMASQSRALDTGTTSDVQRRVYQHKNKPLSRFTAAYAVTRLVYYECTANSRAAVERERQIKGSRREKKVRLIESLNPGWPDLAVDWFPDIPAQDPSLCSG